MYSHACIYQSPHFCHRIFSKLKLVVNNFNSCLILYSMDVLSCKTLNFFHVVKFTLWLHSSTNFLKSIVTVITTTMKTQSSSTALQTPYCWNPHPRSLAPHLLSTPVVGPFPGRPGSRAVWHGHTARSRVARLTLLLACLGVWGSSRMLCVSEVHPAPCWTAPHSVQRLITHLLVFPVLGHCKECRCKYLCLGFCVNISFHLSWLSS